MKLGIYSSFVKLSGLLVISQLLISSVNAHRSSGKLIIETAKKAVEEAIGRHRRDTNNVELNLESLLMSDPSNNKVVEFDLIMDDDQFGTVKSIGGVDKKKSDESTRQKRKAVRHSIYHWPGAVVPYKIDSSVDIISSQARYRINKAMTHWERYTCIKFVEYDPYAHSNYVIIQKGQWCASKLGMAGGPQPLYIALGCLDTGTVIHELGHTLGWVHEQARPDRDDYVTIKWDLVSPSYKSQYVKHGTDFVNTYGIPYDYGSIMHYPSYGELITRDTSAQTKIGQRNRLSFNDIKLANAMYECPKRAGCDKYQLECIDGGFVDHTCKCVCPNGDHKSCTVTNGIMGPFPEVIPETTTPKACDPWTTYDNAYIPGYNEDVGFSLTIEECQTRCMRETMFECKSFDYWKARRQCYLSSTTATDLGVRLRRDSRMVHFALSTDCLTKPTTTIADKKATQSPVMPPTKSPTRPGTKSGYNSCPFEYTNTGESCIRAIGFPVRPVHIAEIDCRQKLGALMWVMDDTDLQSSDVASLIGEGEQFWVKVKNYRSKNKMALFFDFCPYITKENGLVVLKDTLCYKSKGYFCQL